MDCRHTQGYVVYCCYSLRYRVTLVYVYFRLTRYTFHSLLIHSLCCAFISDLTFTCYGLDKLLRRIVLQCDMLLCVGLYCTVLSWADMISYSTIWFNMICRVKVNSLPPTLFSLSHIDPHILSTLFTSLSDYRV